MTTTEQNEKSTRSSKTGRNVAEAASVLDGAQHARWVGGRGGGLKTMPPRVSLKKERRDSSIGCY